MVLLLHSKRSTSWAIVYSPSEKAAKFPVNLGVDHIQIAFNNLDIYSFVYYGVYRSFLFKGSKGLLVPICLFLKNVNNFKAKQSKAKQSKAKQSKAKQSKAIPIEFANCSQLE